MELTYEANLPLLRKLAILLAVPGLNDDNPFILAGDGADDRHRAESCR